MDVDVDGIATGLLVAATGGLAADFVVAAVVAVEMVSANALAICAATRAQSWCKVDGLAVCVIGIGETRIIKKWVG